MAEKAKLLKFVLLGDSGVGKSSLINRFMGKKFDASTFATIGVEFLNKELVVDSETYAIQVWDTAGQERFKSLRTPFYRGADCCLLTFAVDDIQSFNNLRMWKQEFVYYADIQNGNAFPFVILGNKVDIQNRVVDERMVRDWCERNGRCPYYETSAKDSTNVDVAFRAAVERLKELEDMLDVQGAARGTTVDLKRRNPSGGCCN